MSKLTQANATQYLRFLYPLWMVVGMYGLLYVPTQIGMGGDPALVAQNIQAHQFLFRSGIASSLLTQLIFIFVVLLFNVVFEPVNRAHTLLLAVLGLVSVPIAMTSSVFSLGALASLENPQIMALLLKLSAQCTTIATIFWGLWLFPLGYLVSRSRYFPQPIAWALYISAVGYAALAFLTILAPHLTSVISAIEVTTMGEVIFALWFIIRGIKKAKG